MPLTEIQCSISFINKNILSYSVGTFHPPTGTSHSSGSGAFQTIKLNSGEDLLDTDLFEDETAWQDVIKRACDIKDEFDPPSVGEWLLSDHGVTVECGPQIFMNISAPTATIAWSDLKPFMKPDALAP
ncbi:MAG TPA: hypothetical protein VM689_25325 [Aliidongia sp.]|nr:hypothetical protein [Aliidongia sp.]